MHFVMYNRSPLGFTLGMNPFSILPHISQSFSTIDLNALARKSGFMCREARKITPRNFLLAVLTLASQGALALRSQAQLIGWLAEQSISKQAVRKRAQKGRDYLQSLLEELLDLRLHNVSTLKLPGSTSILWTREPEDCMSCLVASEDSSIKLAAGSDQTAALTDTRSAGC